MKETYFTAESIAEKAREFRKDVSAYSANSLRYAPEKSALIILDMQRYFLDPKSHAFVPSAPSVVPGLIKLIEDYHQRGHSVIFTRHVNSNHDAALMGKWWKDIIRPGDPLSEIDPNLKRDGAIVVEKTQYDAFYNTGLEESLKEMGVSQVVVTGVMTHLCCESTARSAFVRGFEVFFPVDGTATYNEEFHKATLLNLSHGFAKLVTVDEILKGLNRCDAD